MDESAIDALCKRLRKHGASGFLIGDEARDALLDLRAKLAAAERENERLTSELVSALEAAAPNERALADVTRERDGLRRLVRNCQDDLAEWLIPDSDCDRDEVLERLHARLDGSRARAALAQKEQSNG